MELKLQLSLLMLVIEGSLAVWQRVTVMEGGTLTLKCPIRKPHMNHVEWKNPRGYVMFFNGNKALKDKRYSIDKLSQAEFTVSVSDVTFKDGGNYTCLQYNHGVTEKKVEVTVLGYPKLKVTKHGGKIVVKCTAEGNHHPPQIYWDLGQGIEIAAQPYYVLEDKIHKYHSEDELRLQSLRKRVIVKCLVRHPALHAEPLMDFETIGGASAKFPWTTSTRSPTAQPQRSTDTPRTTTPGFGREGTTETPADIDLHGPSSESSVTLSTVNEPETVTTSAGSHPSTINDSVPSASTTTRNDTISNVTSTTGWTLVTGVTETNASHNGTEGNNTRGNFDDIDRQRGNEGNSLLLVFLVSCLIVALLVVVIFFAIKLRRAHILWKRENEDSEQSEESSKSKSSHDERLSQGQRRRGIFNREFTKYVVEKTEITAETNTTAVPAAESMRNEETPPAHIAPQTDALAEMHPKETDL